MKGLSLSVNATIAANSYHALGKCGDGISIPALEYLQTS